MGSYIQLVARDWYQYVIDQGINNLLPFLRNYFDYYLPLYNKIRKHVPIGARLLEVGAGTAIFGMWLATEGYYVIQIDPNSKIIKMARENAIRFNVPEERYNALLAYGEDIANMFPPKFFDLSYSRGLLEHFPEEMAINLIRSQAAISKKIISVVPGKHMKTPRLDERAFTLKKLKQLHEKAGLKVIESFSYGDEPKWIALYLPPILKFKLRSLFEIGSDVGVVCL
jgi:hypothetical protein